MGKPSASRCSRGRAKTSICPDLAFVAAGCRSPSDHPATDRGETIVRWSFPHFHRADDDFSRSATESRSASTIGSCPFPVSASLSCIGYLNCPTILARQTSEPEHKAIGDRKAALATNGQWRGFWRRARLCGISCALSSWPLGCSLPYSWMAASSSPTAALLCQLAKQALRLSQEEDVGMK